MSEIDRGSTTSGGSTRTDGRREAGDRTRRRLMEATLGLLAAHGEDAVGAARHHRRGEDQRRGRPLPLRLEGRCRHAVEHAVQASSRIRWRRCGSSTRMHPSRRLPRRGRDRSRQQAAARRAKSALASGSWRASRATRRGSCASGWPPSSRAPIDFSPRCGALPGVPDDELRFRLECASGVLHFLSSGNMRIDVTGKTTDELATSLLRCSRERSPGARQPHGPRPALSRSETRQVIHRLAAACASSAASSPPGASTWATTSARSAAGSTGRSAATRRSTTSWTCTPRASPC